MALFSSIKELICTININSISEERKLVLNPLVNFIQEKANAKKEIRLNFICTHNSRRSHLSQIWAQTMAYYFGVGNVFCYSGGTEKTALFPTIAETLKNTGFNINTISEGINPIYSIKYAENELPIIGFSKEYDCAFNPKTEFCAVLTCSQVENKCPFIERAEIRIPIPFIDPKISDNTPHQAKEYWIRSLQIATEMAYVFSKIQQ